MTQRTINVGRASKAEIAVARRYLQEDIDRAERRRPKTWGECRQRGLGLPDHPCPFVLCRHHLALDVKPNGNLVVNFPDREVWEVPETCSLRVAEQGQQTNEEVGRLLGITREGARQIVARIARRMAEAP